MFAQDLQTFSDAWVPRITSAFRQSLFFLDRNLSKSIVLVNRSRTQRFCSPLAFKTYQKRCAIKNAAPVLAWLDFPLLQNSLRALIRGSARALSLAARPKKKVAAQQNKTGGNLFCDFFNNFKLQSFPHLQTKLRRSATHNTETS